MIRLATLTILVSGLAACASSGPQSAGMGTSNNTEDTNLVTSAETIDAPVATGAVIDYVEARQAEKTAAAEPQQRDDTICRRERVTGSHRTETVCRSGDETNASRDETHEALREAARRTGSSANSN